MSAALAPPATPPDVASTAAPETLGRVVEAGGTDASLMTAEEYLAFERVAEGPRHEFVAGELIEMPGASLPHNRVAGRLFRVLADLAEAVGMEAFIHDMRVRTAADRFRYPDVMISPAPPELLPGAEQDTLLNPVVIVEVLSPSTATTDRVEKQAEYRAIPSLTDYLILSQNEPRCDHYSRLGAEAWKLVTYVGADAVVPLRDLGPLPLGPLFPPAE